MVTYILYASLALISLAIMSWLPGVKVLVNPLIGMITKLVEEMFKHSVGYAIWLLKLIFNSHLDFIIHLTHRRSYFDPTDGFEEG